MPYAIGIDLGGTHIKALAVTEIGEVIHQVHSHTGDRDQAPASSTGKSAEPKTPASDAKSSTTTQTKVATTEAAIPVWAEEVRNVIGQIQDQMQDAPASIGMCAPGLAARDGRTIYSMPGRMAGIEGFDWTEFLAMPSLILNDGQAALLGEVWQGAARGVENAIMLTLGTGVGGAIYANGHLLKGHIGRAGHFGHFCLNPDGAPDDSGMPGSLELAIGDLSVSTRSNGLFTSTKDLVDQVTAGNDVAAKIWYRSIQQLACALGSMINALDPQIVVLGGGIAKAGKMLYEPLERYLEKIEWRPDGHSVQIVPAELGEWSGAMGAAYNALQNGRI